ncbi:hypothetical protein [Streptomyces sp. NPDC048643]|uniref:hypothetical protein n=1 Tax=Streptomyces sp. NPDC048643 TaxID=3155637 RepID=UPI00343D2FB3
MGSFGWFQDGVGYGASDLGNWHNLMLPRGGFKHVFASTSGFLASSNQTARTVAIGAGSVLLGSATNAATWVYSDGVTVAIPTASNDNPRRDLIVVRVATAAADGANGAVIEVVQGTPAASPQAPERPESAAVIAIVDVPKATTTFTVTAARATGPYTDQAALANGHLAINWAGVLPSPAAFPVGFTLYDYGTNQRWVRRSAGDWFTTDPGPWRLCTLSNIQASDGTSVAVSGTLYARESSTAWELSGRVDFTPGKNIGALVNVGAIPASMSRPSVHTYASISQSWSTTTGASARLAITNTGALELGSVGTLTVLYVNVQYSKSPWNTA